MTVKNSRERPLPLTSTPLFEQVREERTNIAEQYDAETEAGRSDARRYARDLGDIAISPQAVRVKDALAARRLRATQSAMQQYSLGLAR